MNLTPSRPSQLIRLLRCTAPDHCPLLVAQAGHPAHLLDNVAPARPRLVATANLADGPVAAKHGARRAESSEHNAEPAEQGLEDLRGGHVGGAQGVWHLGEGARELDVCAGSLAQGEHGGAPAVEGGVGGEVVDGEVGLADVVWDEG